MGAGLNGSAATAWGEDKKSAYIGEIEADVVVAGAGPAGVPAAIAAARGGAKVILLEEDACVGGAPVDMFVTMICGGPQIGIFKEMLDELKAIYDIRPENKPEGVWFAPSAFALVLNNMLAREKNIRLVCAAPVVGVLLERASSEAKISALEYACVGGAKALAKGRVFIDATGTGVVSKFAGAHVMYGREAKSDFNEPLALDKADTTVMPCTWMGLAQRFRKGAALDISKMPFKNALDSGYGFANDPVHGTLRAEADSYLHWLCASLCDTRDPLALAKLQSELLQGTIKKAMDEYYRQGFILNLAPRIGVRECRRIMGHAVISSEDIRASLRPEDTIAMGCYAFDAWGRNNLPKDVDLSKTFTFGIPYRACVAKGLKNLFTAGKIISGTSLALTVYRVQSILACVGQGVGSAAAEAALKGASPENIDVKKLQASLITQGSLPKNWRTVERL